MARKVSQETFDDVVNENMEEFDMSHDDALKDAINQFNKQHVDLSTIDITGGIGRQEVLDCIKELQSYVDRKDRDASWIESVINTISKLQQLCHNDHDLHHRNQVFMMTYGGLNSLHLLLESKQDKAVLLQAVNFLCDLSKAQEGIRDFFEPGGSDRVCSIVRELMSYPDHDEAIRHHTLLAAMLSLGRTVSKSESNKNSLMKAGMGIIITDTITKQYLKYSTWSSVLYESCLLMRALCVHDDLRNDMSCAFENGRFFIKQTNLANALMRLSSFFETHPLLSSAALQAAKNLITNEESVQIMAKHGAIELIKSILTSSDLPVSLVKAAIGVMRNICADDIRKDKIVADGSLDLLIRMMGQDPYRKDGSLMEHATACLAAITLRSPSNSIRVVQSGNAVEILAHAMRSYSDRAGLLRQGALTVRNIAARCPDLRPILLDAGLEDILRSAGRLADVVDEAYGALRDLGCEVNYVKVNPLTGSIEPVYEQFGVKPKLQFNPIYDDDDQVITERIQQEARAPFAVMPPIPPSDNDNDYDMRHNHHEHSSECHH